MRQCPLWTTKTSAVVWECWELTQPPGWRAPLDWASYPRPLETLQPDAAPGMAPTETIKRVLDMQHGERGRLVYDCETRWYLGGLCTAN